MKIVLLNLILHTAEKGVIPRHASNHDCMIYNMARGFVANGHTVTIIASEEYRPLSVETNLFEVIYLPSFAKRVFRPDLLPLPKRLYNYLKRNRQEIDLVISSEVFSVASLIASLVLQEKLMIWHELSAHQKFMFKFPSRLWYNVVARMFMKNIPVTARSEAARLFISRYMLNVADQIVDHGANSEIFNPSPDNKPEKRFIVISQLIERKRIDKIIYKFSNFISDPGNDDYTLDIVGRGPKEDELRTIISNLGISRNVNLHGFMTHEKLAVLSSNSLALLVFTERDLNMVSIPESIVAGTPVLTNSVPCTASFISKHKLGIVDDEWGSSELEEMSRRYDEFHANCIAIRDELTEKGCAKKLVDIWKCDFLR